jgi:hypothetical protein
LMATLLLHSKKTAPHIKIYRGILLLLFHIWGYF